MVLYVVQFKTGIKLEWWNSWSRWVSFFFFVAVIALGGQGRNSVMLPRHSSVAQFRNCMLGTRLSERSHSSSAFHCCDTRHSLPRYAADQRMQHSLWVLTGQIWKLLGSCVAASSDLPVHLSHAAGWGSDVNRSPSDLFISLTYRSCAANAVTHKTRRRVRKITRVPKKSIFTI